MGPESTIEGLEAHPVVQVAFEDAAAYAAWRGARLPSEAEWEWAARGGLLGAAFCWGEEPYPGGEQRANTWQGEFPWQNLALDGFETTSPVGSFPPNGYGLVDMAGNVWEWTSDPWLGRHGAEHGCCGPMADRSSGTVAGAAGVSGGAGVFDDRFAPRVIKGGSYLCAPNYCLRFRPAARQPETADTSTCHLGFRCARSTDLL
jgi:formylglycine-generating enzyme required for sulfatase activity